MALAPSRRTPRVMCKWRRQGPSRIPPRCSRTPLTESKSTKAASPSLFVAVRVCPA